MVVLVLGADISEELDEGSPHPGVDVIGGEIKSSLGHSLEELILVRVIFPLDVMSTCLNINICCPGSEGWLIIFLDIVHLGYPEDILLRVGEAATVESDIVHCRFWEHMDFLNEGVDWGVDVYSFHPTVKVSSGDSDILNHLTTLLGDECEIWFATLLGVVVDGNYIFPNIHLISDFGDLNMNRTYIYSLGESRSIR